MELVTRYSYPALRYTDDQFDANTAEIIYGPECLRDGEVADTCLDCFTVRVVDAEWYDDLQLNRARK